MGFPAKAKPFGLAREVGERSSRVIEAKLLIGHCRRQSIRRATKDRDSTIEQGVQIEASGTRNNKTRKDGQNKSSDRGEGTGLKGFASGRPLFPMSQFRTVATPLAAFAMTRDHESTRYELPSLRSGVSDIMYMYSRRSQDPRHFCARVQRSD